MRKKLSILIKKLRNTTLRKILVFVSRLIVGLLCLIPGYESIVDPVGSNILCDRYLLLVPEPHFRLLAAIG